MIPGYFAVIGAVIASFGGLYYLIDTIKGRAKPNRITWLLWGILPMIIFVAQRVQGVEELSWVSFAAGFTPFLVFAASFLNKKAYWKTNRLDYYLMVSAFIGIILWAITDNANLAIFFVIIADTLAALPTIIKAYRYPQTESWIAFTISTFGFAVGLFAIQEFTFENYAFLIYLTSANGIIAFLSFRKPSNNLHIEI